MCVDGILSRFTNTPQYSTMDANRAVMDNPIRLGVIRALKPNNDANNLDKLAAVNAINPKVAMNVLNVAVLLYKLHGL